MSGRRAGRLLAFGIALAIPVAAWLSCGGSNDTPRVGGTSSGSSSGSSSTSSGSSGGAGSGGGSDASGSGGSSGGSSGSGASSSGGPVADGSTACNAAVTPALIYNGASAGVQCGGSVRGGKGFWYSYNESAAAVSTTVTGTMPGHPGTGDFETSNCAMEAKGSGYSVYAGVGFNIAGGGTNTPGDVSAYTGIQFWAKGTVTGSRTGRGSPGFTPADGTIRVELIGGNCTAVMQRDFGDEYGWYAALPSDLNQWTMFTLNFSDAARLGLAPAPDAGPDVFDFTHLYKIQFQFSPFMGSGDASPTTVAFDVWFDDVSFF